MMQNLTKHWKSETLYTLSLFLLEAEQLENYECCAKIRDNINYLEVFNLAPNQAKFPHPYKIIEDEEDLFIEFISNQKLNNLIDDYLKEEEIDWILPKKRKKKNK